MDVVARLKCVYEGMLRVEHIITHGFATSNIGRPQSILPTIMIQISAFKFNTLQYSSS
jgi:hypothetical protein